jgi:hypothetical protein
MPCDLRIDNSEINPQSLWPIQGTHLFQRFGLRYVGPVTESTNGKLVLLNIIPNSQLLLQSNLQIQGQQQQYSTIVFYTFGPPSKILTDKSTLCK